MEKKQRMITTKKHTYVKYSHNTALLAADAAEDGTAASIEASNRVSKQSSPQQLT